MPLMWNLKNTELGKEMSSGTCEKFNTIIIQVVGMEVLNILGDGYVPTLHWFELDEQTAKQIIEQFETDITTNYKDNKEAQKQLKQYKRLIPKMIGATFRRANH